MSCQIYYKWKTFKDDNDIYIFSLDGSNNCTIINRFSGRESRERDWHLFFRGNIVELREYLKKIDSHNEGFSISTYNTISQDDLFNKLIKKNHYSLSDFKNVFIESGLHQYEKPNREIIDIKAELKDFKEKDYFNHNSRKEYLYLIDLSYKKWLRARGY